MLNFFLMNILSIKKKKRKKKQRKHHGSKGKDDLYVLDVEIVFTSFCGIIFILGTI